MSFYRRSLPHWQPKGAEFFVTCNLTGALPQAVVERMRLYREELRKRDADNPYDIQPQRKIFQKYEAVLDGQEEGPTWLANKSVANLVKEALHHRDKTEYDLYAYCIMSNHLHLVFQLLDTKATHTADSPLADYPLTALMKNLKSYTAVHANQLLNRSGQFWHRESYDRVIRNAEELENTIAYTLNNPVKAELVDHWKEWPHSYCKPEYLSTFQTK